MKQFFFSLIAFSLLYTPILSAQDSRELDEQTKEIYSLVDNYSLAREKKDTILLKSILTDDVDQLVSSGEWRCGVNEAVQGMLRSSDTNPGSRTLMVEKIRFFGPQHALADARYEIKSVEGSMRKMWSAFVLVKQHGRWKIAAIRNMLPAGQP